MEGRKNYKGLMRSFFSDFAADIRQSRRLSQESMAEKLRITGRAYSDLERGIHCFSATALMFLLMMLSEQEIGKMIRSFRRHLKEFDGKRVPPETSPEEGTMADSTK